jgi:succinyl-CoA---D-citramalate CoA-transferase
VPVGAVAPGTVTLDLRRPEGQELFRGLARESDVVLENVRPGTMERWGVGWEDLHKLNPGRSWLASPGTGRPARARIAAASRR